MIDWLIGVWRQPYQYFSYIVAWTNSMLAKTPRIPLEIKHTSLLFKKESITKRSPTALDKLIIAWHRLTTEIYWKAAWIRRKLSWLNTKDFIQWLLFCYWIRVSKPIFYYAGLSWQDANFSYLVFDHKPILIWYTVIPL